VLDRRESSINQQDKGGWRGERGQNLKRSAGKLKSTHPESSPEEAKKPLRGLSRVKCIPRHRGGTKERE
ncbi:hypothetical protein K0M31_009329, partial [Melipona bicolor]